MIKRLLLTEYAELYGITKQTVYNRVNAGLIKKVKVNENGTRNIYIEFEEEEEENKNSNFSNFSNQNSSNSSENSNLSNENSNLSNENSNNSNQNSSQDSANKLIEYLTAENQRLILEITEKDKQLSNMSERLLTLLENQQQLTNQAQVLNALDKPKEKKRGLLYRLFGKKSESIDK